MRVISFVEGASKEAGGIGFVGVPYIAHSIADQGHEVLLSIGGDLIPGTESLLKKGNDLYKVVAYPAYGRRCFSIKQILNSYQLVKQADFVMLHSLYSFPVLVGYLMARLHKKPYGLWPHGVLAPFQRRVSARKKAIFNLIIGNRILNEASVLFYSALGEREEAKPLNLQPPTIIVPHGMDLSEYENLPERGVFRQKYINGYEGPLVLYLGRLASKKGLELLIAAMAQVLQQVPEARLVIVGAADPPRFEGEIRTWIKEHGIENRTIMTGLIPYQEKLHAFVDADLFVLPSHAENFGFAMFEAMASRLPVVISDSLNLAEEVKKAGAGLVLPRQAPLFAEGIITLLRDAKLRQEMGENGHRLAELYTWDSTGDKISRTFKAILNHNPLPEDLYPQSGVVKS
ncbi:MAG: glycosyltransferase [Chloroflexi bacterium]|nr:glycosyltransferase [Chloroflexota bacterium]